MFQKITYFSVAVTDIDAAIKMYQDYFGLKQMTEIVETKWGFRNAMMGNGEQALIEIVQPSNPNSALARYMQDNVGPGNPDGQGIYLVGIEVDNLKQTVDSIRAHGGRVADDPEMPNVAWPHPLSVGNVFIELQQASE